MDDNLGHYVARLFRQWMQREKPLEAPAPPSRRAPILNVPERRPRQPPPRMSEAEKRSRGIVSEGSPPSPPAREFQLPPYNDMPGQENLPPSGPGEPGEPTVYVWDLPGYVPDDQRYADLARQRAAVEQQERQCKQRDNGFGHGR